MSSFSMQRLRSLLPGGQHGASFVAATTAAVTQRHSVSLEPEIGFQISIETCQQSSCRNISATATAAVNNSDAVFATYERTTTTVPELNVQLIAARHLPTLFGFKVVQGYLIKVKLFPGSKRLDSSIQTNSWPKFNETFKFPLAPDIKPSLKQYSSRRGSKSLAEFTPDELFRGHFVVFTVYALLELPPTSFNRLNKTYRSLRDKSSNLVQKVVESSSGIKENGTSGGPGNDTSSSRQNGDNQKMKRKSSNGSNPRDAMPPLTISESRRNIGSVTCYLEPKLFKRNTRNGSYSTEELWLPIKDITTTVPKVTTNNLVNSAKGIVEIILELRDLSENSTLTTGDALKPSKQNTNGHLGDGDGDGDGEGVILRRSGGSTAANGEPLTVVTHPPPPLKQHHHQWKRMTSEVKRKMQMSNTSKSSLKQLELRVITSRMRCSNKVKDELEANAGSVYVKTTVFEHNIYVDAWKSANFYPSLSTKWDVGEAATLTIPLHSLDDLDNLLIRTTLATKTKMAKKLVLGTVFVGVGVQGSGAQQMQRLQEVGAGERVSDWHCYQ